MNLIFAFDGPDASGKTMISTLVTEELRMRLHRNYVIRHYRMPGGTPVGAKIREVLKNPELTIEPLVERLLFAADTAAFFAQVTKEIREVKNTVHIVDRWSPITEYMYCLPRGVTVDVLKPIISLYMNKDYALMPDILFLVDVAMADMQARLHAERRPACRIEQLGDQYHALVWKLYAEAARESGTRARAHCHAFAHSVARLDNTNPSARTVRDVAMEAVDKIVAMMESMEVCEAREARSPEGT